MFRFRCVVARLPASAAAAPAGRAVRARRALAFAASDDGRRMPVEVWRKRLRYHAGKRGMRENEMVLGRFAELRVASMTETELGQFQTLLNQFDPDVNKWLMRKQPIPADLDTPVWREIVQMIDKGPDSFDTSTN